MTVRDYMISVDRDYGSQSHQEQFVRRMEDLDARRPCTKDHSKDVLSSGRSYPTHRAICYVAATLVIVLASTACAPKRMVTTVTTTCAPPRAFGAIPDDGVDDRAGLQQMLDACGATRVDLEAGKYRVTTPPFPRGRASLTMREGTTLRGAGLDATEISFDGDDMLGEWQGIRVASHTRIVGVSLTTHLTHTVEQTHVIRGEGPLVDVKISYVRCVNPQGDGKVGDCVSWVGYPPAADGTGDKRIWDVEIDHCLFDESGRSGVAWHSGVHGTLAADARGELHYTSRIHHNRFRKIMDQAIDGEVGTGASDVDGVEIDHNVAEPRVGAESTIAFQIQSASHIWMHDNVVSGSLDLYGCDQCRLADNVVTLSTSSDGSSVVSLRKAGTGTTFRDETYVREATAGAGYVFSASQKITAPDHLSLDDVKLAQYTPESAVYAWGVVGLAMRHLTIECDWTAPLGLDAIRVSGSVDTRTTDIVLSDSNLTGPYVSGIAVGGSYAGTGAVTVERTRSSGITYGMRCANATAGAAILGPVNYLSNQMPRALCAPLVVP